MIAAQYGETMQATVERLAQAELERWKKGGQIGEKSLQVPPLSEQRD